MPDMPTMTINTVTASTITSSSIMVSMDRDGGNVRIDWAEVEKQARGKDPYLMPLAKIMLAVRDKAYQPINPQ
jgi:hypothetical protein